MANVRTQIRTALKAALDAALSSLTYTVFDHRVFSVNATTNAIVDMRVSDVNVLAPEVMSDAEVHVASLDIRISRTDNEADITTLLEADEVAVNTAVYGVDWSSLLERQPHLSGIRYQDGGESGAVSASMTLQYEFEYRINEADHETVIP